MIQFSKLNNIVLFAWGKLSFQLTDKKSKINLFNAYFALSRMFTDCI